MEKYKEKTYLPVLDGLRFFAFLLVFIHHAPVIIKHPIWLSLHIYGFMGVDLFLCLSAFLFTKLLYTEYERTGSINIGYFYIRRTLRIWPLYYLFVIMMVVVTFFKLGDFELLYPRFVGLLTFTDNFITAYTSMYNPIWFAAHLWTIAYEEQFYAVIPWILRKLFQTSLRVRIMILSASMGAGYIIRAISIGMQTPHPAIWVLPVTHFDSILFGLIIGLGLFDPLLKKIPWPLTGLIGLGALITVCQLPSVALISWNLMLTYPLIGLGTALILYTLLRAESSKALRWLSSKPLAFLGSVCKMQNDG